MDFLIMSFYVCKARNGGAEGRAWGPWKHLHFNLACIISGGRDGLPWCTASPSVFSFFFNIALFNTDTITSTILVVVGGGVGGSGWAEEKGEAVSLGPARKGSG